jgi:hypothetical protein
MVLPGAQGHQPARNEVEAQNQIVQLLFQINHNLGSINIDLRNVTAALQQISNRIPR